MVSEQRNFIKNLAVITRVWIFDHKESLAGRCIGILCIHAGILTGIRISSRVAFDEHRDVCTGLWLILQGNFISGPVGRPVFVKAMIGSMNAQKNVGRELI